MTLQPGGGDVELQLSNGTYVGKVRSDSEGRSTMPHGRGVFSCTSGPSKGNKYDGEFWDGKKHGRGVYLSVDGDQYEGEFRDGKRHGRGLFTSADGSQRYEGG